MQSIADGLSPVGYLTLVWGPFRYLFALQIKRNLTEGRLACTENTAALLASHLVQCE